MKIRSVAVNQFKKFTSPVALSGLNDGLNIVVGPNEMGKSTLLDALMAALFERYSSRAQTIVALQNERNLAAPVVEVVFEMAEGPYRIRKRFLKKAYARLTCPDGRTLEGDEAEAALRELLGFDTPGKTGARPETLGMWSVLWVRQGDSFDKLALPDRARASLHDALESEVGAVLGGDEGRALLKSLSAQLETRVTRTGRPRGEYQQAIEEVRTLHEELDELTAQRERLVAAFQELESIRGTLERLEDEQVNRKNREALEAARTRHGELAKLESRIEAAAVELKLRSGALDQARRALADRRALKARIDLERQSRQKAQSELESLRSQEAALTTQLEQAREILRAAEAAASAAEADAVTARRLQAAATRSRDIALLESRLEKAREAEQRQRTAEQALAGLIVTEAGLESAREAHRVAEEIRGRLLAAATRVSFDFPAEHHRQVLVNGEPLVQERTSVQAIEPVVIEIPGNGRITVEPAIENREALLARAREAERMLARTLEACGVASLDAAESALRRRETLLKDAELARQEVAIHAPAADGRLAGAEALAAHVEGLRAVLERELAELGALGVSELPAAADAEAACTAAEDRLAEAQQAISEARANLTGPEHSLGALKLTLGAAISRLEESQTRLARLETELEEAESAQPESLLGEKVSGAESALREQQEILRSLEDERGQEPPDQVAARIRRLEKVVAERQNRRGELREAQARLSAEIELAQGAGLDEAVARKAREVELAEAALSRHEQEVKMLELLLATLKDAERDAKTRYLSPVLRRLIPYLQLLFPGAEITLDEDFTISGVVREHGHEERFEHLSLGTREQIAVLVRLAFAEMLAEQGQPASVVLDDALVFSDDARMERMFDVLNMVANRVQVLVFTCREQLFEGIGGQQLRLQALDGEVLSSA